MSWATQRRDEAQDIHGSEHPSQVTRASGLVEKVVLFENNDTGARLGHLVGGREADRTSTNNNHIVLVLRGHGDFFGYLSFNDERRMCQLHSECARVLSMASK